MIRLRLLVLLVGASVVAAPALVGTLPVSAAEPLPDRGADEARELLALAARAATTRTWSGTQYVGSWRAGAESSAVVEVTHRPGGGSTVTSGGAGVVTADFDERLLSLLADHYELAVAGAARCAGRSARLVEARRRSVRGAGQVAGRFWLDAATGLVLRREVYDDRGGRLSSSALLDLTVAPPAPLPGLLAVRAPDRDDPDSTLPAAAWHPPGALPAGLQLFDAKRRDDGRGPVLHLAYSDGLSTLSVFAQRGALPDRPGAGFRRERVHGTRAWVQPATPERIVWQGGGQVFTLVSDADPAVVRAAVGALPRDPAPRRGLRARLSRGFGRLCSWLNPLA